MNSKGEVQESKEKVNKTKIDFKSFPIEPMPGMAVGFFPYRETTKSGVILVTADYDMDDKDIILVKYTSDGAEHNIPVGAKLQFTNMFRKTLSQLPISENPYVHPIRAYSDDRDKNYFIFPISQIVGYNVPKKQKNETV